MSEALEQAVARIERWEREASAQADAAEAFTQATRAVRVHATAPGGGVTATVDGSGVVVELALTEATRRQGRDSLAADILATISQAQAGLAEKVAGLARKHLGTSWGGEQTASGAPSATSDPATPGVLR